MNDFAGAGRLGPIALLALPLLSVIVPNVVVGYGLVIPGSCIAGLNELTVGYAASIAGYIPAYAAGTFIAYRLGRNAGAAA